MANGKSIAWRNTMTTPRTWAAIVALCLLAILAAGSAQAQAVNYPTKPVTIICDAAAGATPDVVARFVADGFSRAWGQQVVVVNHPGGNGSIAAHAAAEAAPDG